MPGEPPTRTHQADRPPPAFSASSPSTSRRDRQQEIPSRPPDYPGTDRRHEPAPKPNAREPNHGPIRTATPRPPTAAEAAGSRRHRRAHPGPERRLRVDHGTADAKSTPRAPQPRRGSPTATRTSFQQVLDETRATGGFPGVIALVRSPQGTWIGTSGTTGEGLDGAPTPTDHTRVGSLTKTMTATVILQLAEEGKLDLSDPIGKYVPGMPNGDTATIQQLAEMTSGIAPYTTSDDFKQQLFADPLKVWTPEELIAFEQGQPAEFAPGEGWQYSNTNYVLLGMVIEQVTGKTDRRRLPGTALRSARHERHHLSRLVQRHRRSPPPGC